MAEVGARGGVAGGAHLHDAETQPEAGSAGHTPASIARVSPSS